MASYRELLAERDKLNQTIFTAREKELEAALATVRELVDEFGLTEADVFPHKRKPHPNKGAVLPAKYRNPETGTTWTGRGKSPLWLASLSKEEREKFLIK
jgi:DNA-binding protein H-NS